MDFPEKHSLPLLFMFHLLFLISAARDLPEDGALKKNVSALLVFGDSTVDPGNNNYISTPFKSNFPPYGRDFVNHRPTGRFTDGRLPTDFIASYLGLKESVPPYLDSTLSNHELMTGVSFASGGSGYDPLTPMISSVIPISQQLQHFRDYKKKLESAIGKQRTKSQIEKALFLISAGTNDFVVNYFTLPVRRLSYTASSYEEFLLQQLRELIQGLWDEGARKIAVAGLPPMGCLPIVITLHSNPAIPQRGCVEQYSFVARDYNQRLQNELNSMQQSLANRGARIHYVDIYRSLFDMIQDHGKFGFDHVNVGCCGTGLLEASFLCNPLSFLCTDTSKYVFWDSMHPTEKAYHNVFKDIRPTIDLIIGT